jgi:hypothetical protein
MRSVNHTPFPASAFLGVMPQGKRFYVVALRQTLTWDDTGNLFFADRQAPLCEVDEPLQPGKPNQIRQESDRCPYKPRCDVIVNAGAYAPLTGARVSPSRFEARLSVRGPDVPMPLPPKPLTYNQFVEPSPERMAAWRAAVERAKGKYQPGPQLIDKKLRITDERPLTPLQMLGTIIHVATLGIAHPFGRKADSAAVPWIAGLGVRPRSQRARAKFMGTADAAFIESGAALPPDFDFALWNAAWPDQQVDKLAGDEVIELTNLCAPGTTALMRDANGNGVLRLTLPPWQPYVLMRFASGAIAPAPLTIDTLIIEPERSTVSLVFRHTIAQEPEVLAIEVRQVTRAQWQAMIETAQTATARQPTKQARHG